MQSRVEAIVREILSSSDLSEITLEERKKLERVDGNILPLILQKIVLEADNSFVRSKALNLLLECKNYDMSGFLISGFEIVEGGWKDAFIRFMGEVGGAEIRNKLLSIAMHHSEPDFRYQSVAVLGEMGDASVIDSLEKIANTDDGVDFEGFRISDVARASIKKLNGSQE